MRPRASTGTRSLRRPTHCPTLILWTKYNPDLSAENARKALPHLKKGQMIVLENSAHWPQWEETELYDKVHLGFLQS